MKKLEMKLSDTCQSKLFIFHIPCHFDVILVESNFIMETEVLGGHKCRCKLWNNQIVPTDIAAIVEDDADAICEAQNWLISCVQDSDEVNDYALRLLSTIAEDDVIDFSPLLYTKVREAVEQGRDFACAILRGWFQQGLISPLDLPISVSTIELMLESGVDVAVPVIGEFCDHVLQNGHEEEQCKALEILGTIAPDILLPRLLFAIHSMSPQLIITAIEIALERNIFCSEIFSAVVTQLDSNERDVIACSLQYLNGTFDQCNYILDANIVEKCYNIIDQYGFKPSLYASLLISQCGFPISEQVSRSTVLRIPEFIDSSEEGKLLLGTLARTLTNTENPELFAVLMLSLRENIDCLTNLLDELEEDSTIDIVHLLIDLVNVYFSDEE